MGHPRHGVLGAHPHPRTQNSLGCAEVRLQTQLNGHKTLSRAAKAAGFSPAPAFAGGSRSETQLGLARAK